MDDYLMDGIYGKRLPKQAERDYFLGTLRERIVLALTIGQVMSDKGLAALEETMQNHPKATLVFNGDVAYKYLKEEKDLADAYHIPYTIISNEEIETDIGAVLAYDYAIDKETIFLEEQEAEEETTENTNTNHDQSFFSKVKKWFS